MSKTVYDDSYFIEGLKNRSHAVFEALFRCYYPDIYRFAYSYLMSRSQAEDILQDVFASLWKNAGSLPEETGLRSYIYTAVKHACFDHLKHIRVVDSNHDKLTESLIFSGTVEYEENPHVREKVTACLELLPERQRRIIELKISEGLNYKEIAEKMKISEATVHTHIKRAYATIRKHMPVAFMLLRIWGVF